MGPTASILPDGTRLHLHYGPIDLIIGADGDRKTAFEAATRRFDTLLDELMAELDLLRQPIPSRMPQGSVAQRMYMAAQPHGRFGFLTPMACVAGAVADEVLGAMTCASDLDRAYVNNGGDIAIHLAHGALFKTAMRGHDGCDLGHIVIASGDGVGGIASSGHHGRSLSLGIADSVTVLAHSAAAADAAATMIANAVDVPGHADISRQPACEVVDNSDLGERPVVVACAPLSEAAVATALAAGYERTVDMKARGMIGAAALFLQGRVMTTDSPMIETQMPELLYA